MAIDGLIVMSEELEGTAGSIYDNQVPKKWSNSSYPSMKPLSFWMTDLANRIRFINKWVNEV